MCVCSVYKIKLPEKMKSQICMYIFHTPVFNFGLAVEFGPLLAQFWTNGYSQLPSVGKNVAKFHFTLPTTPRSKNHCDLG